MTVAAVDPQVALRTAYDLKVVEVRKNFTSTQSLLNLNFKQAKASLLAGYDLRLRQ